MTIGNIDPDLAKFLKSQNFLLLREENGVIYGVCQYLWTFGLCTDVTWTQQHKHRWCFKDPLAAVLALQIWNLEGDPPGPWVKQKYLKDRMNPLLYTQNEKNPWMWDRNNVSDRESWALSKNVSEGYRSLIEEPEASRVAEKSTTAV